MKLHRVAVIALFLASLSIGCIVGCEWNHAGPKSPMRNDASNSGVSNSGWHSSEGAGGGATTQPQ